MSKIIDAGKQHVLQRILENSVLISGAQVGTNFALQGTCGNVGPSGKEPASQCRRHRDIGSIPGSGRFPGGGHGNSLQYSCLENPMDRGAWRPIVHRVTKSWT